FLVPADVETGEVAHREGAHRETEIIEHAVDVPRHRAFEHQLVRLALALRQHAVADEAGAHAHKHGDLADLAAQLHASGNDFFRGLLAAHDLEQTHHVRGREEVQADNAFRALGDGSDFIDVQIRRVGGEDRALLDDAVELFEHVFLHINVLVDGFDHEIAIGEIFEAHRRREQAHALFDIFHREAAALGAVLVVLAHHADAAVERFLLHFHDGHGDAGIGEIHRNAAAHG